MPPLAPLLRLAAAFLLVQSVATVAQDPDEVVGDFDEAELMATNSADSLSWSQWLGSRYFCKCLPGDLCWPGSIRWGLLNATVGGNLREVIPDAAVCYNTFEGNPSYNAAACQDVRNGWTNQNWV